MACHWTGEIPVTKGMGPQWTAESQRRNEEMRLTGLWAWESHAPRQRRASRPAPRPSIKHPRDYAAPFHLNSRATMHPSEGPWLPQEKAWQTKNLGPQSSLFPIINISAFSFTNQSLIKLVPRAGGRGRAAGCVCTCVCARGCRSSGGCSSMT